MQLSNQQHSQPSLQLSDRQTSRVGHAGEMNGALPVLGLSELAQKSDESARDYSTTRFRRRSSLNVIARVFFFAIFSMRPSVMIDSITSCEAFSSKTVLDQYQPGYLFGPKIG